MRKKVKLQCIVGARPNYMKIAPLIKILDRNSRFETQIVHTGQHYDQNLYNLVWKDLGIRYPDVNLSVGSGSHAVQTAQIMISFEQVVLKYQPDLLIVAGDVNSTLACSLVAAKLNIPVAHIEAGLRNGDLSMPEEINRILTDQISSYLFAPSCDAVENLRKEGFAEHRIHFVGNLMVDSLISVISNAENVSKYPECLNLLPHKYILATFHRPFTVDKKENLSKLVNILKQCAQLCPLVIPVHPRTLNALIKYGLLDTAKKIDRIHFIDPLGYIDFITLMKNAKVVLTDSGCVQEESTILGVPCLTARENTERPITISEGTNQLVGLNDFNILKAIKECIEYPTTINTKSPEGWDGKASERVVSILEKSNLNQKQ